MDLFSTHQRSLVVSAANTSGPVLELGSGWYSTPLLHELCKPSGRVLFTIDDSEEWVSQFRNLETRSHSIKHVPLWEDAVFSEPRYGLVFVDHAPAHRRKEEILRLIDVTDVFVVHDWEDKESYGYDVIESMFEFISVDNSHVAQTAILSSKIDVSTWLN